MVLFKLNMKFADTFAHKTTRSKRIFYRSGRLKLAKLCRSFRIYTVTRVYMNFGIFEIRYAGKSSLSGRHNRMISPGKSLFSLLDKIILLPWETLCKGVTKIYAKGMQSEKYLCANERSFNIILYIAPRKTLIRRKDLRSRISRSIYNLTRVRERPLTLIYDVILEDTKK